MKSSFQNTISIDMTLYLVCVSRKPKKEQKTITAHTRSIHFDIDENSVFCISHFFFFFLTRSAFTWNIDVAVGPMHCARDPLLFEHPHISLEWHCQWVPYTVHGTHKHIFSPQIKLKMGPTILFTNLKIILL